MQVLAFVQTHCSTGYTICSTQLVVGVIKRLYSLPHSLYKRREFKSKTVLVECMQKTTGHLNVEVKFNLFSFSILKSVFYSTVLQPITVITTAAIGSSPAMVHHFHEYAAY